MTTPAVREHQSPLEVVLLDVHATLADLLVAADEQHAAVVDHDRDRLENVTRQQEQLSVRLARAEAKRLLASGSNTVVPDWFDFYNQTRLHGFEGYALLRGGNTVAAVGELQVALASLGPSAIKQRTVFLADLATASVQHGDVDRACDLAIEAATALTTRRYATCVNRLRDFRSTLRPYANARAVHDLDRAMVEL